MSERYFACPDCGRTEVIEDEAMTLYEDALQAVMEGASVERLAVVDDLAPAPVCCEFRMVEVP